VDKTKDVMVSVRIATPKVGPEATKERKKDWPSAEVHIKGMIPLSPEFYIFP